MAKIHDDESPTWPSPMPPPGGELELAAPSPPDPDSDDATHIDGDSNRLTAGIAAAEVAAATAAAAAGADPQSTFDCEAEAVNADVATLPPDAAATGSVVDAAPPPPLVAVPTSAAGFVDEAPRVPRIPISGGLHVGASRTDEAPGWNRILRASLALAEAALLSLACLDEAAHGAGTTGTVEA